MLVLAGGCLPAQAVIADGSAFAKCKEMFAAQGGDTRVLDDYSLFEQPDRHSHRFHHVSWPG